jgi:hypothetical protein
MTKLVAEKGRILKETRFEAESMTVKFQHAAFSMNSKGGVDLGRVDLAVGDGAVEMTYAQAISFANEVLRRCQP